jgi:hypothetical protein
MTLMDIIRKPLRQVAAEAQESYQEFLARMRHRHECPTCHYKWDCDGEDCAELFGVLCDKCVLTESGEKEIRSGDHSEGQ